MSVIFRIAGAEVKKRRKRNKHQTDSLRKLFSTSARQLIRPLSRFSLSLVRHIDEIGTDGNNRCRHRVPYFHRLRRGRESWMTVNFFGGKKRGKEKVDESQRGTAAKGTLESYDSCYKCFGIDSIVHETGSTVGYSSNIQTNAMNGLHVKIMSEQPWSNTGFTLDYKILVRR